MKDVLGPDGKPASADVVVLDATGQAAGQPKEEKVSLPEPIYKLFVEHGDDVQKELGKIIEGMVQKADAMGLPSITELPSDDRDTDALAAYLTLHISDWAGAAGVPAPLVTHVLKLLHTLGEM